MERQKYNTMNTCYCIPASKLRVSCVRCLVRAENRTCDLWLRVCDGQWSRSRDGPVSSIISIIVAFTGRVL